MYANILLPTDGSATSAQGVSYGLRLAKALGSKVTAVVVTEPFSSIAAPEELRVILDANIEEINAAAAAAARTRLKTVADQAATAGVACTTVHVFDRWPSDGILDTARDRSCDLIVMSSHSRRGVRRILLGSQAFDVVTRSRVPVLVVRVQEPTAVESSAGNTTQICSNILIATDGSPIGDKAVGQGIDLARHLRASVTFVVASGIVSGLGLDGVSELGLTTSISQISKATEKAADAILQRCAQRAATAGVVHELVHVRKETASDAILETAAKYRCELIMMGSQGYRGMERLLLGSQAYNVVGRATLPVLIVR